MMAAFGFSVGDFVTCLQLIREVAQALGDSKGSAAEYQSLFQTLVTLNQSLAASELVYLQWNNQDSGASYRSNGTAMINGMLFERQKCKELLENFLMMSRPYTDAFVKERGRAIARNWRKVTWLFQKEEVVKLEKQLQRHLQALRIYTDALFQYFCPLSFVYMLMDPSNQSAANGEVMRSQVGSILSDVANIRTDVSIVVKALQSWDSPRAKSLGYPWEASSSLGDNVLLLDANGRSVLLPMLFLSSPMILHDLLNIMYRGLPGHRRILRGEYNITDEENDGVLVEKSNWNSVIRPGMQISLNVVLRASTSWDTHRCPRCNEAVLGHVLQGKRRRCQKCQLTFRVFDRERISEESETTGTSGSVAINGIDESPRARGMSSSNQLSYSESSYKKEVAEDNIFQRVHYQRDIKKIDLATPVKETTKLPPDKKLNINELPPLHRAAATGDLAEIVSRLNAGDNINAPLSIRAITIGPVSKYFDLYQCTPLHLASYFGKARAMNLLLDRGASIVARDADEAEPLVYAIWGEDPGLAIALLARGADVGASDYWGRSAIHIAAQRGDTWLIRLLLQYGANVEAEAKLGHTALHEAAWSGHEAVVSILLESNPNVSMRNSQGYDILNFLCLNGRDGAIKMLLDYGADIAARDDYGDTPLHNAARSGHIMIVQELLARGAGVECRNNLGLTPLHYACRQNRAPVVKLLLENGSDIHARSNIMSEAIHYASISDGGESTKILLDYGSDVESFNKHFVSPLHVAAFHGSVKVAELLLNSGAVINTENDDGESPLTHAAWRGYGSLVKLLLEKGANIDHQSHSGMTALHAAAGEGHEEVVSQLLENGADPNIVANLGGDPLSAALGSKHEGTVALVLEKGATVSKRYSKGHTPLHLASWWGLDKSVTLLLSLGADVNAIDDHGDTPLLRACYSAEGSSTVAILLSHGADPNIAEHGGWLPLIQAVVNSKHDNGKTLRLLLERGANPTPVPLEKLPVLHFAVTKEYLKAVKVLLESGKVDVNALDENGNTALDLAANIDTKEIWEEVFAFGGKGEVFRDLPRKGNVRPDTLVENSTGLEETMENLVIYNNKQM